VQPSPGTHQRTGPFLSQCRALRALLVAGRMFRGLSETFLRGDSLTIFLLDSLSPLAFSLPNADPQKAPPLESYAFLLPRSHMRPPFYTRTGGVSPRFRAAGPLVNCPSFPLPGLARMDFSISSYVTSPLTSSLLYISPASPLIRTRRAQGHPRHRSPRHSFIHVNCGYPIGLPITGILFSCIPTYTHLRETLPLIDIPPL